MGGRGERFTTKRGFAGAGGGDARAGGTGTSRPAKVCCGDAGDENPKTTRAQAD